MEASPVMSSEGTMKKLYQIINFQYQPVRMFEDLDDARDYIEELQRTYKDEKFYIVELSIVPPRS